MRITESKLRQIIRKTIKESFSGSYTPSGMRMDNRPKIPAEIDSSKHTGMSTSIDALTSWIDELAIEENLELSVVKGLRSVANKLNDCMTYGDTPEVCAMKIMDSGLENAFAELGYVIHDALDGDALSDYALNVERIMDEGLTQ